MTCSSLLPVMLFSEAFHCVVHILLAAPFLFPTLRSFSRKIAHERNNHPAAPGMVYFTLDLVGPPLAWYLFNTGVPTWLLVPHFLVHSEIFNGMFDGSYAGAKPWMLTFNGDSDMLPRWRLPYYYISGVFDFVVHAWTFYSLWRMY
eukprot:gnl/Spiro4/17598_TR9383_c0_g1_i1.p2 gnl/Spiro4/17598_TR9383_c0_g1~~gnl/Spiro4/17598_TR9383_c0_g1_i1.p2  ORF type:complete len:146 (+),score=25.64 gnl/Spiro4/17598_TR9383_c0_g1_i1:51-488(+)